MLERLTRLRTRNRRLVAPPAALSVAYRAWVSEALTAARAHGKPPRGPKAPRGFTLEVQGEGSLWLLRETEDERKGGGALLLRVGDAQPIAFEVPHSYYDSGTLPIAFDQFERLSARALLFNTVHRAAGVPDARKEDVIRQGHGPADVAHIPNSLFAQAHLALVDGPSGLLAIQVHGYADDRARTLTAVMSGANSPFSGAEALADGFSKALPGAVVAAYPRDTRDLGGTENRQARDCIILEKPFVHIELSYSLRQRMRREPAIGQALAEQIARIGGWSTRR